MNKVEALLFMLCIKQYINYIYLYLYSSIFCLRKKKKKIICSFFLLVRLFY